jgi:hypothetical protein
VTSANKTVVVRSELIRASSSGSVSAARLAGE